jgi:type II secretory pathway pseudopilin PulG
MIGPKKEFHRMTFLQKDDKTRELQVSYFNLMELLVCMTILVVLSSLLSPSLRKMMDAAHLQTCINHLHGLGLASAEYANDHDDMVPITGYGYAEEEQPDSWNSAWGPFIPYMGEKSLQGDGAWYAEMNLGQYVWGGEQPGPSGHWAVNAYQNHGIYDCPSAIYRENPMTGEENIVFAYQVNSRIWGWLAWINDQNKSEILARQIRFSQLSQPSKLMSIGDTAVNFSGMAIANGGFGQAVHGKLDREEYWYWMEIDESKPDGVVAPMRPNFQQQGDEYWRGSIDFRHQYGVNTLMFDGSARNFLNGSLKAFNFINF